MKFENYRLDKIFTAAMDVLCEFSICSPMTDIFSLLAWETELHSYACAKQFHAKRVPEIYDGINGSESAFTILRSDGSHIACINEMNTLEEQRFSAAHELGHIILQHPALDLEMVNIDEETFQQYAIFETEANIFAIIILCPYPVADFFNLTTVEQYQSVFCVTQETAKNALHFRKKAERFTSSDHYNYLVNLMSLYLRGYYRVDGYWREFNKHIFRDVKLKNHPLYSFENLQPVLNTLAKLQRAAPVIHDDAGNMIDLTPFLKMKANCSDGDNATPWKTPLFAEYLSHPFTDYYEGLTLDKSMK